MPWLQSNFSCGELRPSLLVPHLALPSNASPPLHAEVRVTSARPVTMSTLGLEGSELDWKCYWLAHLRKSSILLKHIDFLGAALKPFPPLAYNLWRLFRFGI